MGTLTRAQLRAELDANLGSRLVNLSTAEATALTTRYNRALHLAQLWISRKHGFLEMRISDSITVTAASIFNFTLYNVRDIYLLARQISSTESVKLIYVPQRQWDQLLGAQGAGLTGDVYWYTRRNQLTVEWYKIPTVNFTLWRRFSVWPSDFTDDNAVSQFLEKDELIIARATAWMFRSLGQREEAVDWQLDALATLNDAIREDLNEPDLSMIPRGISDTSRQFSLDLVTDPFAERSGSEW